MTAGGITELRSLAPYPVLSELGFVQGFKLAWPQLRVIDFQVVHYDICDAGCRRTRRNKKCLIRQFRLEISFSAVQRVPANK